MRVVSTASRQVLAGCTLTSITPGSGVTLMTSTRGVEGRSIALDAQPQPGRRRRLLEGGEQIEIFLDPLERRHEDAQQPVPRLDGEGGADGGVGRLRAGRSLQRAGQRGPGFQRVLLDDVRIAVGREVLQPVQRQAIAERRVAGHEEQLAAPGAPALRDPGAVILALVTERQDEAPRVRAARG